jgi:hypothetical protein
VGKSDILGAQESCQPGIARAADIEGDFTVERTDGDLVELLADEADVPEVGGTGDLCAVLVLYCLPLQRHSLRLAAGPPGWLWASTMERAYGGCSIVPSSLSEALGPHARSRYRPSVKPRPKTSAPQALRRRRHTHMLHNQRFEVHREIHEFEPCHLLRSRSCARFVAAGRRGLGGCRHCSLGTV